MPVPSVSTPTNHRKWTSIKAAYKKTICTAAPTTALSNLGNGSTGIETPTISRPAIRLTGDPRSGYLTLVTSANLTLARAEIVSVSGQVIASYNALDAESTGNAFTLPIGNLARGFYLVRAYDHQGGCTTCKAVLP
mgnify:CR=1 FL=1